MNMTQEKSKEDYNKSLNGVEISSQESKEELRNRIIKFKRYYLFLIYLSLTTLGS